MTASLRARLRRAPAPALGLAVLLAALVAGAAVGPPAARAQRDEGATVTPRIRVRSDTVIRWQPRYVFTTDETQIDRSQGFWQRVDELPLYERLSLDARDLADGHVDVHLSAWGLLDLTFDDEGGIAAGDFAQAYVRGEVGPVEAWGGRRFLSWGVPGGLHLDGGGVGARTDFGLHAQAIVGRPVTPRVRGLLGASPDFTREQIAYGALIGFTDPRKGSVSAAYVERRGDMIPMRTISVDGTWRPHARVDLGASVALDAPDTGIGISQATAQASWLASNEWTFDLFYTHRDPRRLIPSWSLLSVFATSIYHEAALGGTWRFGDGLAVRAEGGLRHFDMPDRSQLVDDPEWGYRAEVSLRALPIEGRPQYRIMYSRRDDGTIAYNLADVGVSWRAWQALVLAVQGTFAIDDEGERDSVLARVTAEYPIADGWALAATVDWARTPIASSELRGLVRATWRAGGGASR